MLMLTSRNLLKSSLVDQLPKKISMTIPTETLLLTKLLKTLLQKLMVERVMVSSFLLNYHLNKLINVLEHTSSVMSIVLNSSLLLESSVNLQQRSTPYLLSVNNTLTFVSLLVLKIQFLPWLTSLNTRKNVSFVHADVVFTKDGLIANMVLLNSITE